MDIFSTINVLHELNHQLLTCWNHYLGVPFYTYHKLLKTHVTIKNPTLILECIKWFFHIFLIIKVEPFIFNMLNHYSQIAFYIYYNISEHMQLNIFVIIFEWFSEFFYISWTINIFTWVELSILSLLKLLFKHCILRILMYIETHITT